MIIEENIRGCFHSECSRIGRLELDPNNSSTSSNSTNKASSTVASTTVTVFIKDREIGNGPLTPMQVCKAIAEVMGSLKFQGVQNVKNLWLIYLKDKASRFELCAKGQTVMNGNIAPPYDCNSYTAF